MKNHLVHLLGVLLLVSCDSGSSGGGIDSGPASAKISLSPDVIDTGDVTVVKVSLDNFTESSVAVKIRFPLGLKYVYESSVISVDDQILDTGPADIASSSDYSYLVYYIEEEMFYPRTSGSLDFVLEGIVNVADGKVGVDIDLDNPEIKNSSEFDIADPKFDAVSETKIRVGPVPVVEATTPGE
jgi:hypothetical protein